MNTCNFATILAIAKGMSLLLYPHAEIVIHDLTTGCISAIFNNMSKRQVGDESLLDELEEMATLPDIFPLYFKTNWDGRRMKSITMTLRDQNNHPFALMCINLDLSKWEEMHRIILDMIQPLADETKPAFLFKEDWREKINVYVSDYLKREGLTLKALTKEKKQELVHALYEEGAFQAKNAASYVAEVLNLSRGTIYNYLRLKS